MHRLNELIDRANRAFRAGNYAVAYGPLVELAKHRPRDPRVLYRLGASEAQLGLWGDARKHLQRAIRIRPDPITFVQLAGIHKREGDLASAWKVLDRASSLDAGHPAVLSDRAELLMLSGRAGEAHELLRGAMDRGIDKPELAGVFGQACERLGRLDEGITHVEHHLDNPDLTDPRRRILLFRLGSLLDRAGEYDRAFVCFERANGLCAPPFDPEGFLRGIDDLIRAWGACEGLPRATTETDRPVFLVGMPRSGSSLVEQIADTHPLVHGGGELPFLNQAVESLGVTRQAGVAMAHELGGLTRAKLTRAGGRYIQQLHALEGRLPRFVDKNLFNFLHLGLVQLMFPRARIVHCVRDPLDTCLSTYFQAFDASLTFTSDLGYIGSFYRGYRRLMEHWRSVLELPMLDVVYEELVADQERHSRRLIEFLGLDWDEACMRFHESKRITVTASNDQVRQPVYRTSVTRYRHYEAHLGPLMAALGEFSPETTGEG